MKVLFSKNNSLLLVFCIAVGLLFGLYSDIILNLNEVLFCNGGDGFKNYYNYLYHIKHDPNYLSFDGMNYPYGELIFLVDIHPFFANFLKFFCTYFWDISDYGVGILNFCMLFSIPIAAVFLFLILDYYKCPRIAAIIAALGISFLCSTAILWQHGHYSLSYVCFFPMGWFLIIKYLEGSKDWMYSSLIGLNTLFWFYSHNYLGFILLAFSAFVWLFHWLIFTDKKKIDVWLHFLVQVLIPTIIVVLLIKTLDQHSGRVEMPYLFQHRASLHSILLPLVSPFKPIFELLFDFSHLNAEPWSRVGNYIGLSTIVILFMAFIYLIYGLVVGKVKLFFAGLNQHWWVFLLSAFCLLMFSFAFPFRYGLDFLLPSIIKQFVGLGRFAWAFYFVITTFSLVVLNTLTLLKYRSIILTVAGLLLLIEGMAVHRHLSEVISIHKSPFQNQIFDDAMQSDIDFNDFQAIFPVPFYHEYTGLNALQDDEKSKRLSMQLSIKTGLPLMSAMLSRNSVAEAQTIVQLLTPAFIKKPIQNYLNDKPLLVVFSKSEVLPLEKEFLSRAKLLYSNEEFEWYQIDLINLFTDNSEEIILGLEEKAEHYLYDSLWGFYKSDSSRIAYVSFDDLPTDFQYRGEGALKKRKSEFGILLNGQSIKLDPNKLYQLSFWAYNNLYDQYFNTVWLEVKNESGDIIRTEYINPSLSNVYDGKWSFNEISFQLNSTSEYIMLCSQGSMEYSDSVYFDEVLIRPLNVEVFQNLDNQFNWNNFKLFKLIKPYN